MDAFACLSCVGVIGCHNPVVVNVSANLKRLLLSGKILGKGGNKNMCNIFQVVSS